MATKQAKAKHGGITLLRPGVGAETFDLAEGCTLADLLRQANVEPRHSSVMIDGKELAEHLVLRDGMVITVAPGPRTRRARDRGAISMGDFHNDSAFEEVMRLVEEERKAEKEQG